MSILYIDSFLGTLENQKIFLFGTAGFGGSESYFESIITDVKQYISPSNIVVDSFMCQGKMSENVLERYQKILIEQPENKNTQDMIDNYNQALSHPDMHDVLAAQVRVKSILDRI